MESSNIPLPPVSQVKLADLHAYVKPFDVIVRSSSVPNWMNIIIPGQYEMLKQEGYSGKDIEAVCRYTHVGMVMDNKPPLGELIESTIPRVQIVDLSEFKDREIVILRYPGDLEVKQLYAGFKEARRHLGIPYDYFQYLTYPFFMIRGWCPKWARRLFDSKRKPVCSSFIMEVYQAMDIGKRYTDLLAITPGRLVLMDDIFKVVAHFNVV